MRQGEPASIRSPFPGIAAFAALQSACSGRCPADPLTQLAQRYVDIGEAMMQQQQPSATNKSTRSGSIAASSAAESYDESISDRSISDGEPDQDDELPPMPDYSNY